MHAAVARREIDPATRRDAQSGGGVDPGELAAACLAEVAHQRGGCIFRQREAKCDALRVRHRELRRAAVFKRPAHDPLEGVRNLAREAAGAHQVDLLRAEQGLRDAVGIRANQAAGAQLDPAEIAHHRRQDAVEVLMAQHFEHRSAGRAARLAVIDRGRLPAGQQGPADVVGVRMLVAQPGDDLQCLRATGRRPDAADEAALLDDEFAADLGGERLGHGRQCAPVALPNCLPGAILAAAVCFKR